MATRVRYAPSPTGHLHIGNARTALFNYLFAKHLDGELIIRIEDTDIERNIVGGEKSQLDNLKWLGIEWDESIDIGGPHAPYNQLARNESGLYTKFVDQLIDNGYAYECFCSSEQLEEDAQNMKDAGMIPKYIGRCRNLSKEERENKKKENIPYSIRFKVNEEDVIKWEDLVKGKVEFIGKDVSGDFNIVKQNGIPTYNFVVVLDDHLMNISHVLRGEDHISNTPKQIMIYNALSFEVPLFGHMSLIVNDDGKKLSKRDTTIIQFIEDYKKLGYLPDALFNFITLLGWSPEGEEEIFSKEELINMFDYKRLSKSSAKFDVNKLKWINNVYMKKLDDNKYLDLVLPFLEEINTNYDLESLKKIALLYKEQLSYGSEIKEVSSMFFKEFKIEENAKEFIKENNRILVVEKFLEIYKTNDMEIKEIIKEVGKELEVKGKELFMPVRIGISGVLSGPEVPEIVKVFGKKRVIKNLEVVINEGK